MTNKDRSPRLIWALAAFMLANGALLGLAEFQHYRGQHPWEPFLWELSSAVVVGALIPAIYRWHAGARCRPWAVFAGLHLLGAVLFVLCHVAGMFGLRFAFYALMGQRYEPGSWLDVLAYETGKDLISYVLIVGICHGLQLWFEGQQRDRELQAVRSELAEARLARLAEQIQPHFLFNTLNLISATMYEDVARADRLLCELAELLRQQLAAQATQQHTLADELRLVEPYLSLMQARFGERLAVRIEVSEEARRCQVPTLLLISPVENAIKHDVALNSAAVEVRVLGNVANGELCLAIENSGTTAERDAREGAIGLANLRQRVATLYGSRAAVSLEALAPRGSRLAIHLPLPA